MSNDLITRLRHLADTYYLPQAIDEGLTEAADALEAQAREIEALREPLTDAQLLDILQSLDACTSHLPGGFRLFARAVEAAHGIGEARNE